MSDPAESKPNPLALIARALEEYDGDYGTLAAHIFISSIRQILAEYGEGE